MKDIFLDTNLSKKLINPIESEYLEFINWLYSEGALVMSNKLKCEYLRGNQNLIVVINKLTIDGRLNPIKNSLLKSFTFPKRIENKFISDFNDRVHIKSIVLSHRKIALIGDNKLLFDINSLPRFDGIKPIAEDNPSKIDYK